jgi:hypothetical protein
MSPSVTTELWIYRVLAVGALIGTWTFNIRFMLEGRPALDFIRQGFAGNALAAVSIDILLCVALLFPWMTREARRYGIKHLWAYLFFSITIAISVTFPLFLAARRKAVAERGEKRGPTKLTALYPVMGAVALVLCNLFTIRYFLYEGRTVTGFVTGWFANNAGSSLAVDLIFLGGALLVLLIAEARRGHVRSVALYLAMSALGLAFALPWMLRDLDMFGVRAGRKETSA